MQYITYVLLLIGSIFKGWAFLPQALLQSITGGGLWRWLAKTLCGFRYLTKKGLPTRINGSSGDQIHFLNTGNSDAILLESDGHFALIDAAEDSEYPAEKRSLAMPGWENYVTDYIKRAGGGSIHLDFVMGTHAHSDHIGGFDTVIRDPDITIGQALLKPYDDTRMLPYEQLYWDNDVVHAQMTAALAARNVPLTEEIPESLTLGNFKITLFNRGIQTSGDENDSSIGALVEYKGKRVFLAGDINNISYVESKIGPQIGKVDLLKAGHHGHNGSSTLAIATSLRPDTVIFHNKRGASISVITRFICAGNTKRLLSTGRSGGVLAEFCDDSLRYYAINEFAQPLAPQAAAEESCEIRASQTVLGMI